MPPALTLSEAYATLGLGEGSAYDEVLAAKNVLLERHADDLERRYQVGAEEQTCRQMASRPDAAGVPHRGHVRSPLAAAHRPRPAPC